MLRNEQGFSLSEGMIAMSIILMLIASILPIHNLIQLEQQRFKTKHLIALKLHDELQEVIWNDGALEKQEFFILHQQVTVHFKKEAPYVKGCANWEDVRDKKEKLCFYGIKKE